MHTRKYAIITTAVLAAVALLFTSLMLTLGSASAVPQRNLAEERTTVHLAMPALPVSDFHPYRPQIHRQAQMPAHYAVRPGDSLSAISQRTYGTPKYWQAIFQVNRSHIKYPDSIYIGQSFLLPVHPGEVKVGSIPRPPVVSVPARHAASSAVAPAAGVPPPAPVYSYSGGIFSYGALEALWIRAGGPAWAAAHAAEIAECESGGNPGAHNPSGASGLWQILGQVVGGNVYDPYTNALNAVSKFRASGDTFAQWVCQ